MIQYEHQASALFNPPKNTFPNLKEWLASLLGDEYVYRVKLVWLYPDRKNPADDQIRTLKGIPYLPRLAIWPGAKGKHKLDEKSPGGLTDEGLALLPELVPKLEHLSLFAAPLTDEGIQHLYKLDELDYLQLGNTHSISPSTLTTFANERPEVEID